MNHRALGTRVAIGAIAWLSWVLWRHPRPQDTDWPMALLLFAPSVPLVAAGITAAQLGVGPALEAVGTLVTTAGALATAWLLFSLALWSEWPRVARILAAIAAASLALAMALAAIYGLRFALPVAWLHIPRMWLFHGTVNAFGFGLCGLAAWTIALRRDADGTRRGGCV